MISYATLAIIVFIMVAHTIAIVIIMMKGIGGAIDRASQTVDGDRGAASRAKGRAVSKRNEVLSEVRALRVDMKAGFAEVDARLDALQNRTDVLIDKIAGTRRP